MSKLIKSTLIAALAALGALASGSALAWHHRAHVGVFIGGPVWWGYPYPYYAYPPTVIVRETPPTQYIEQSTPDGAQPQQGYWYYCADSKTYYPYVKDCPAGWQKVVPQTQPAR
jgi:hypothetical protein